MQGPLTVRLFGGLGNQMFQYAAGYAAALASGRPLRLEAIDRNPVLLKAFPLGDEFVSREYNHADFSRRVMRKLHVPERGVYRERHYHFSPLQLEGVTTLEGYFQSWRYFEGVEAEVRRRFSWSRLSERSEKVLSQIKGSSVSLGVHIRRGDYMTPHAQLVHGILPSSHYERGINLFRALLGVQPSIFVFSDDPGWVRENVHISDALYVNSADSPASDDLILMSQCQHQLIANSSYSWWAAWLNAKPRRIVVGPRQWFTPIALRERNVCDLCPPDWILL